MSGRGLSHRHAWALCVGSAVVLVIAMAALSVAMLRSERRSLAASAGEAHAARLRTAVAAMDRWLGPVLAREAGRHHSDYVPYRAPRRLFSAPTLHAPPGAPPGAGPARLPPGSVVEPSPLLGHASDTLVLHVEWSEETGARSPQVPRAGERELALASGLAPEALRRAEVRLSAIEARVDFAEIARWVREEAPASSLGGPDGVDPTTCLASDELREGPLAPGLVEDAGSASVGRLLPRFIGDDDLLLARDVRTGASRPVQVVAVDWSALSALLLEDAAKDVRGARLVPGEAEHGVALATLPAALVAAPPPPLVASWTPRMSRLALAWIAFLVALGAIGWAVRTSIVHAERRSRFAAAVSHELRTPLTTLRLYSEMLADGVITDPAVRQEYLQTIQSESARLASLVENVLLHARIETTSGQARRRMTVRALVESIAPVLRRRADEAGRPLVMELDLDTASAVEVEVDRDAVERVLFNLVDNACKHGVASRSRAEGIGAGDPTLRLEVRRRGSFVDLQVRDHGPGIPRALVGAVFEAFRRGEETGAPGAGLGLALSRSLARDLRGELSLVPSERGACFRLSLRLA